VVVAPVWGAFAISAKLLFAAGVTAANPAMWMILGGEFALVWWLGWLVGEALDLGYQNKFEDLEHMEGFHKKEFVLVFFLALVCCGVSLAEHIRVLNEEYGCGFTSSVAYCIKSSAERSDSMALLQASDVEQTVIASSRVKQRQFETGLWLTRLVMLILLYFVFGVLKKRPEASVLQKAGAFILLCRWAGTYVCRWYGVSSL
jgi:hypothetical protein